MGKIIVKKSIELDKFKHAVAREVAVHVAKLQYKEEAKKQEDNVKTVELIERAIIALEQYKDLFINAGGDIKVHRQQAANSFYWQIVFRMPPYKDLVVNESIIPSANFTALFLEHFFRELEVEKMKSWNNLVKKQYDEIKEMHCGRAIH